MTTIGLISIVRYNINLKSPPKFASGGGLNGITCSAGFV